MVEITPEEQYKVKKKRKEKKRQRNTTQMKEQTRNTKAQINEEEIGKLPEKEFNLEVWEKETSNTIS